MGEDLTSQAVEQSLTNQHDQIELARSGRPTDQVGGREGCDHLRQASVDAGGERWECRYRPWRGQAGVFQHLNRLADEQWPDQLGEGADDDEQRCCQDQVPEGTQLAGQAPQRAPRVLGASLEPGGTPGAVWPKHHATSKRATSLRTSGSSCVW